jgi:uncharacterized FlaG/YvyC family protein
VTESSHRQNIDPKKNKKQTTTGTEKLGKKRNLQPPTPPVKQTVNQSQQTINFALEQTPRDSAITVI